MTDEPPAFRVFTEVAMIHQLSRTMLERVLPEGLTLPQFAVLDHFARRGGDASPARRASAFQVTRQTMTSTLQRLERAGLVVLRPDPADGRGKRVAITERGMVLNEGCIRALAAVLEDLARHVPDGLWYDLMTPLADLRRRLDRVRDVDG